MNEKEAYIYKILDVCVEECAMDLVEATMVTAEDVLAKCKRENVVMTRCIYTTMLLFMGYSKTTIAASLFDIAGVFMCPKCQKTGVVGNRSAKWYTKNPLLH